jgi:tetratricopeptide (TPR) repeat protein
MDAQTPKPKYQATETSEAPTERMVIVPHRNEKGEVYLVEVQPNNPTDQETAEEDVQLLPLPEEAEASIEENTGPLVVPPVLAALNIAIRTYPDEGGNWVLRGEWLIEFGAYDEARNDLEQGIALCQKAAESAAWGYIYTALIDRAERALKVCTRNLA